MIEIQRYYGYLVMPEDRDPAEELKRAFARSGHKTDLHREDSETNEGINYVEWHLDLLPWTTLIEVVEFFNLEFERLDNDQYIEQDTTGLGDLVYSNKDGVKLVIFALEGFGGRFKDWAPTLKVYLSKEKYVFEQRVYHVMDYSKFDEIIRKHYKKPDYECVAAFEWSNDEEHSGTVSIAELKDGSLAARDLKEFEEKPGWPMYGPHWTTLLAGLAKRGIVPEGEYIIQVNW